MEEYVKFEYRSNLKHPGKTQTIVIRDGEIVKPIFKERSRTGAHGYDYYRKEDVENADVILNINISNSGKHYCELKINKPNPASIMRALQIHKCPSVF